MTPIHTTLLKKYWRSDTLWTHPFIYKSFLKYIPLFLDTRALLKSQFWPREKLESLQGERLRALFVDARSVPYWREVLADIPETLSPRDILAKLPITSKKLLTEEGIDRVTDRTLIPRSDADHTSGSTGRPFHFYFDWHASLRSYALTERIFRTATGGKRYPIVYMRARERNGFTPFKHVWFFLRGHHGVRHRMDEFRKLKERFKKGFVLYGYTSSVLEVVRNMEKENLELPLCAVMVAGENLPKSDRAYIERVMRTRLSTLYASRETGYLAFECPHKALHISEEWAHLEIVDDEGVSLPHGHEGRIIVTTFDNRVMPFIRYDIGDRGVISDSPCPCSRTLLTLTLKGRVAELIELEDGRVVSLLDVSATVDWYWNTVRQFQIIQKSKLSFVLKVVPGPNYNNGKELLEAELIRLLHPRVKLHFEIVDEIPEAHSGKAVYFLRDFDSPLQV